MAINTKVPHDRNEKFDSPADNLPKHLRNSNPQNTILREAEEIIYGDREETYGHPAKNLKLIAAGWSLYLRQKYGKYFGEEMDRGCMTMKDIELTPEDVCWMMMELKKCRELNSHKRDNLVDTAGYLALIERCKE